MVGEKQPSFHEDLRRDLKAAGSSDRSFGLTFAAMFAVIAGYSLWSGRGGGVWWLASAASFLVIALLRPALLAPVNRLWTRFGLLLHAIVSPVVMAGLFFAVVTPIGLLMRACGKAPLLKGNEKVASYWVLRSPPGPAPESMKNQF